jgi:hypothetical protein
VNIAGNTKIAAAVFTLLAAPAQAYLCGDLTSDENITAPDALAALRASVGQNVSIDCGAQSRTLVTGLAQCSDEEGDFINCEGTGQDGELQKGARRAFVDNGDGTVTDRGTGLQWELFDDGGLIHDRSNKLNQAAAYDKIAKLNVDSFAGHSDWRLPNLFEQMTLGNLGGYQTGLYPEYFNHDCTTDCVLPDCACVDQPSYEWSSTTVPLTPSYAFAFRTVIGDHVIQTKDLENYTARAVRGGWSADEIEKEPAFESSCADVNGNDDISASDALEILREAVGLDAHMNCILRGTTLVTGQTTCFDEDGQDIPCAGTGQDGELRKGIPRGFTGNDDTVTDSVTGLEWEVMKDDGSIHDKDDLYKWIEAQGKIDQLNEAGFAGHSDWRVPNFFENQSLVFLGDLGTGSFWSSSFPLNNKEYAYMTNYATGHSTWELKTATLNVRAVRGGH